MSHFRGAGIGALGYQRNSENLIAVGACDLHGIVIRVLYVLLLDPKEHPAFRAFSNEHGHGTVSKMGVLNNDDVQKPKFPGTRWMSKGSGSVQKSPPSKAAAIVARRAYNSYVSTEQWRERRWRLFSRDP